MQAKDAFSSAMRAEIEAIVARYEAMTRAHHEALVAAREQELAKLRQDLATLLTDRERARASEADLRQQLKAQLDRSAQLDRELGASRQQLDQAARRAEALQAEAAQAVAREREAARVAQGALQAQIADLTQKLEKARAEAAQRLSQVEGELRTIQQEAESLSEAFSAERAFVEACQPIDGSALHEALRSALDAPLTPAPATYAAIKARRPDALLTAAIKDRGRSVVTAPLSDRERAALPRLAEASGCELLTPEHGVRYSASTMDKASTQQDPAEEGNVLDCLIPGLRLAGTEGALVFPRVVVATG